MGSALCPPQHEPLVFETERVSGRQHGPASVRCVRERDFVAGGGEQLGMVAARGVAFQVRVLERERVGHVYLPQRSTG